jgi:hypothetical protein
MAHIVSETILTMFDNVYGVRKEKIRSAIGNQQQGGQ